MGEEMWREMGTRQTDGRTDRQRVSGRLRANNYSLCLAASMTMYHNNPSLTQAHTHTHAGSSRGNESLFICTRDNPALLAPLRATEGGGRTGGRCGLIREKDAQFSGTSALVRSKLFSFFDCYYFSRLSTCHQGSRRRSTVCPIKRIWRNRAYALSPTTKEITLMKSFCRDFRDVSKGNGKNGGEGGGGRRGGGQGRGRRRDNNLLAAR